MREKAMVQCRFCGKDLLEAKNRNRIEKLFCNDRCRWNFHNRGKLDAFLDEVRMAIEGVMKKHGYIK